MAKKIVLKLQTPLHKTTIKSCNWKYSYLFSLKYNKPISIYVWRNQIYIIGISISYCVCFIFKANIVMWTCFAVHIETKNSASLDSPSLYFKLQLDKKTNKSSTKWSDVCFKITCKHALKFWWCFHKKRLLFGNINKPLFVTHQCCIMCGLVNGFTF